MSRRHRVDDAQRLVEEARADCDRILSEARAIHAAALREAARSRAWGPVGTEARVDDNRGGLSSLFDQTWGMTGRRVASTGCDPSPTPVRNEAGPSVAGEQGDALEAATAGLFDQERHEWHDGGIRPGPESGLWQEAGGPPLTYAEGTHDSVTTEAASDRLLAAARQEAGAVIAEARSRAASVLSEAVAASATCLETARSEARGLSEQARREAVAARQEMARAIDHQLAAAQAQADTIIAEAGDFAQRARDDALRHADDARLRLRGQSDALCDQLIWLRDGLGRLVASAQETLPEVDAVLAALRDLVVTTADPGRESPSAFPQDGDAPASGGLADLFVDDPIESTGDEQDLPAGNTDDNPAGEEADAVPMDAPERAPIVGSRRRYAMASGMAEGGNGAARPPTSGSASEG